jgi:putative transposase
LKIDPGTPNLSNQLPFVGPSFKWDGTRIKLAKMAEPLAIRLHRQIPKSSKVSSCVVSKEPSGKYFISILCDEELPPKPELNKKIGIDLGLSNFAVLSDGVKIDSLKVYRNYEKRLGVLQRRLSRKQKGSHNRNKARIKVAKVHELIKNTRADYLHKLSNKLINENQVIAIETLQASNMVRNKKLSKSISDASWYEFTRQLKYKADWYGRQVINIDKWFPSSKRCSECGFISEKMPLNIRSWKCPDCGAEHDRDVNAARNILMEGLTPKSSNLWADFYLIKEC